VFDRATALRARAQKRVPRVYHPLVHVVGRSGSLARRGFAALLCALESAITPSASIQAFLRARRPDLLLVTPLIELGSQQVDYVKCARQMRIRSVLCVASWDNLTSKGLIRVVPDHVAVWNEAQKREAVELHGARPEQVVVTGAQLFDGWFERQPSRSREDFCRTVGLGSARPFILYVGSSIFIAPDEVGFAERWLAALRHSEHPALRDAGVLVRPHPANSRQWRAFDDTGLGDVAIWPPVGTDPNAPDFRRDYFDSVYYSAAVVGVNTSAQLEASILGRPVFTVCVPEFVHAHDGALHFQHLTGADGAAVTTAASIDEHVDQLAGVLDGDSGVAASASPRRFVESFLRPRGIDVAVAPLFADAITRLAALPRPVPPRPWLMPIRPAAFAAALVSRAVAEDRPAWVYAVRPVITAAIWTWAAAFELRQAWRRHARTARRRASGGIHRWWHESSRAVARRTRRAHKKVVARFRGAGGAAKRIARRAAAR
jgi:hypothetical protein